MPYEETTPQRMPLVLTKKTPAPLPLPAKPKRRWIRREKIGPAFWTVTGLLSLVVNLVLIIVLVSLGQQLFTLKTLVQDQVLGGLHANFAKMDEAHIRTTIPVSTSVPAKFDLPLNTYTVVTLTEDTRIAGATILEFNAGELSIRRASTNIILPKGTRLPVELNLTVPVDQQIPVNLVVDVDIPLNQTDLHEPFVGLQDVVKPYYNLLEGLPETWEEIVCARVPESLCQQLMH
jgi:hypothetical protein